MLAERAFDALALAFPEQPVVDEDAGELVADRPVHERRCDTGIDAAGRPQITCSLPTCARIRSIDSSMNEPGVHVGSQPQMRNAKFERISSPRGVCATSGWNCTPKIGASSARNAATGRSDVEASVRNPGG